MNSSQETGFIISCINLLNIPDLSSILLASALESFIILARQSVAQPEARTVSSLLAKFPYQFIFSFLGLNRPHFCVEKQMANKYQPTWDSLRTHPTPQWLRCQVRHLHALGCVLCSGQGPNATWYPYNMYREGTPQCEYHVKTFGGPEKFGWKDFIPTPNHVKINEEPVEEHPHAEYGKRCGGSTCPHKKMRAGWAGETTRLSQLRWRQNERIPVLRMANG